MTRDQSLRYSLSESAGRDERGLITIDFAVFHTKLQECGYVVLPFEPTEKMIIAGRQEIGLVFDVGSFEALAKAGYQTMRDAFLEEGK